MKIEIFKSKLSKGQLEAMAIDTIQKQMENVSPLESLRFAKKLYYFSDKLIKEAEKEAKMVWDQEKEAYPDMNYTQGGAILDLNAFDYRKEIANHLKSIDEQLKLAQKSEAPLFIVNLVTGEPTQVPKVPIKNYRKDTINVKI